MANAERLQGTLDFILTHPDRHNQAIWFRKGSWDNPPDAETFEERTCGSVGCFAGWAAFMYGHEDNWRQASLGTETWVHQPKAHTYVDMTLEHRVHVSDAAREILGLTKDEQLILFDGDNTIDMLVDMVSDLVDNGALDEDGLLHYQDREQEREDERRYG